FSPLGSSMEKGVENPLKRLTKRSSAAGADDILAPRISLVPIDDSRSRRSGRGGLVLSSDCAPEAQASSRKGCTPPPLPFPAWRLLSLGSAAIIRRNHKGGSV